MDIEMDTDTDPDTDTGTDTDTNAAPDTAAGMASGAGDAATVAAEAQDAPRMARTALLSLANEPQMRLAHDGVVYDPVPGDAALGALLFALRPDAVGFGPARHADRMPLRMALDAARQFERVLSRHVARADRDVTALPGRVTVDDLRSWVLQAAKSVPAAEQERFCWRLARALGPDPWGDGSPAIELSGQQFALFETRFDEEGMPVAEPEAAPAPAPAPDIAAEGDGEVAAPVDAAPAKPRPARARRKKAPAAEADAPPPDAPRDAGEA